MLLIRSSFRRAFQGDSNMFLAMLASKRAAESSLFARCSMLDIWYLWFLHVFCNISVSSFRMWKADIWNRGPWQNSGFQTNLKEPMQHMISNMSQLTELVEAFQSSRWSSLKRGTPKRAAARKDLSTLSALHCGMSPGRCLVRNFQWWEVKAIEGEFLGEQRLSMNWNHIISRFAKG